MCMYFYKYLSRRRKSGDPIDMSELFRSFTDEKVAQ